ncbi:MAG: hypothetical protein LBS62_07100 [Clostridiales bacterium]|jgi:hypothetical protein|nr:hypothetical protein [Clostridiales bacterium]
MKKYSAVFVVTLAVMLLYMRAAGGPPAKPSEGFICLEEAGVPLGTLGVKSDEYLRETEYQRKTVKDVAYTVVFELSSEKYLVFNGFRFLGYLSLGEAESINGVRWDYLPEKLCN